MIEGITIEPAIDSWPALIDRPAGEQQLFGQTLATWRAQVRGELRLSNDRPIIATGHQTLLWHPGILAKYLALHVAVDRFGLARANLIVDQHAGGFGSFEVPIRRRDGDLGRRRVYLTDEPAQVPMALHPSFAPAPLPTLDDVALESARDGARRIHAAIHTARVETNAALQMGAAIEQLMTPWVAPMPHVTTTQFMDTCLARRLLEEMVRDPWTCARDYNDAVRSVPEAGIGSLMVRDDYVELPLWRIAEDGRRMHAYDGDVERWLERGDVRLMPRALFMTALIRLAMCDLFIHGTGGATYDRAMERWMRSWLGVEAAPFAVVSATMRLPLEDDGTEANDLEAVRREVRRLWHDPEGGDRSAGAPGPGKQAFLSQIERAPRNSPQRAALFRSMHADLVTWRAQQQTPIEEAESRLHRAQRRAVAAPIVDRRTWPFPLYPAAQIDALARRVAHAAPRSVCVS